MRKLLLAIIALCFGSVIAQDNYLSNGGFEGIISNPYQSSPQIFTTDEWLGYFGSAETQNPYEGNQCLKLTSTYDPDLATEIGLSNEYVHYDNVMGYGVCKRFGTVSNPESITLDLYYKYNRLGNDFATIGILLWDTLNAGSSDDKCRYASGSVLNGGTAILDSESEWTLFHVNVVKLGNNPNTTVNKIELRVMSSSYFMNDAIHTGTITAGTSLYIDKVVVKNTDQTGMEELLMGSYIYPNPAKEKLTIEMFEPIREVVLSTTDGKIIRIIQGAGNSSELDVSDLQEGIYQCDIILENGKRRIERIVKN